MPDDDIIRELNRRVSALTDENAELKVALLDAFVALANSSARAGAEQLYDQVLNRIIGILGLTDDDINALLRG
ncbi:MAG: hypothetical protein HXY40_02685 [Chloroflexi bacterium]|nr:hypothetical protein [Chloroflexota bacterium]